LFRVRSRSMDRASVQQCGTTLDAWRQRRVDWCLCEQRVTGMRRGGRPELARTRRTSGVRGDDSEPHERDYEPRPQRTCAGSVGLSSVTEATAVMGSGSSGRIAVELDDLIYRLQSSGGASVYWAEVTSRIERDPRFKVTRLSPGRWRRAAPVFSRAAIFHSSHFRFAVAGGARTVTTVHDLNYELGLVPTGIGARVNVLERKISYFAADALICVSENTRKDLLEVYPSLRGRCPVSVIHHGVTIPPRLSAETDADRRVPDRPFVLYVGGRKWYKNFVAALDAFRSSNVWRDGVRFVCTGSPFDAEERAHISRRELESSVLSVGNCAPVRLFNLYSAAQCLLYSSLYEGFGLPPLEAMACGCPVVAMRSSSIPEVVGEAAILVDPASPDGIARAIHALQDASLRAALAEKGRARARLFSWDDSAHKHAAVYQSVARGEVVTAAIARNP
jgi:glycosyltransferase involved in cell wall biosynthesis